MLCLCNIAQKAGIILHDHTNCLPLNDDMFSRLYLTFKYCMLRCLLMNVDAVILFSGFLNEWICSYVEYVH